MDKLEVDDMHLELIKPEEPRYQKVAVLFKKLSDEGLTKDEKHALFDLLGIDHVN